MRHDNNMICRLQGLRQRPAEVRSCFITQAIQRFKKGFFRKIGKVLDQEKIVQADTRMLVIPEPPVAPAVVSNEIRPRCKPNHSCRAKPMKSVRLRRECPDVRPYLCNGAKIKIVIS